MDDRRLPGHIVSQGLKLADGGAYYGIPMTDLTRDEAIAALALTGEHHRREIATRDRQNAALMAFEKAANG